MFQRAISGTRTKHLNVPLLSCRGKSSLPTYFSDPNSFPPQHGVKAETNSTNNNQQTVPLSQPEPTRSVRDGGLFIAIVALAYLAVDNYQSRVKVEKLKQEAAAIHVKTLQLQQQNFMKSRKQQERYMLKERTDLAKRSFKMSLHIAMLKKQLEDAGFEPKEIGDVIEEFEKNGRMMNSVRNLTGQAIWLGDGSEYARYLPDFHEYDKGASSWTAEE